MLDTVKRVLEIGASKMVLSVLTTYWMQLLTLKLYSLLFQIVAIRAIGFIVVLKFSTRKTSFLVDTKLMKKGLRSEFTVQQLPYKKHMSCAILMRELK